MSEAVINLLISMIILMTSLVYCVIYARLLRALGGARFCWTTLAFAGGEGMLGVRDHISSMHEGEDHH